MLSIKEYLRRGPSTSKEIQAATGQSQSTVSRQIKNAGSTIIQIQEGRSVKYAATCNAFGAGDRIPLGVVDNSGKCTIIATVRPLNCGHFFIEPETENFSSLLLGDDSTGLFEDLPYFLHDMKPQGFIGRQTAKKIAMQLEGFPSNPKVWNTDHIGRYLIANGDDLPGNFLFGEPSLMRIRKKPFYVSEKNYPELAANALKGEPPGSSAGGEQPKFTAFNKNLQSHVIVKFSPKGDNDATVRWKDILITEYHAASVLDHHGYPAVIPNVYELGDRLFLEFKRFDRVDEFGRNTMLSLDVIDREFAGFGSGWPQVMEELLRRALIDKQALEQTQILAQFGRLINNNDMHLGNLSLSIQNNKFYLLPAYDMCSMGFAPNSGEVLPLEFVTSRENISKEVEKMAYEFWNNILNDNRVSDQFKKFASLQRQ